MTELKTVEFNPALRVLIRSEVKRGKSLGRILTNYLVSQQNVSGQVIDLASKSDKASYNRFLKPDNSRRIIYTDKYSEGDNLLKIDLEQPFGIEDQSCDTVLCFNALEHVYNYNNVVTESFRILKTGGQFIGSVPFLVNYHPDPNDYFRYTHEALDKILSQAGFQDIKIYNLGFGPLTAAYSHSYIFWPKFMRGVVLILSIRLDQFIVRKRPQWKFRFPLAYFFQATKS